jgi:hypothetical protein
MEPKEFKVRYNRSFPKGISAKFVKYKKKHIDKLSLSPIDRALLLRVGLPDSTAPFIHFEALDDNKLSALEHLVPNKDRYYIIGSNGSGDAIAIDSDKGHVVYFNHDLDFEKILMNSSIETLAECICLYMENWKTASPDELLTKILNADPILKESNGFWITEIEILRDEIS